MNGAVAAAGGDMAKAALDAGLVDRIGDRARVRGAAGRSSAADDKDANGGYRRIKLGSYIADEVDAEAERADRHRDDRRHDRRRQGRAGTAGGDTIAKEIEDGVRQGHQGAGRPRRQPRRLGARLRAHPPGAARGQGQEDPGRRLDGQRRASGGYWVSTPADFIYAEPSTITGSIGVFGVIPSFQGTLQKLGVGADGVKTTPLSGEPDLLQGPLARSQPADPDRRRIRCTAASSASSPRRATRRRSRSTRSRRAACGTAAPPTSSGWSTRSAGSTRRSPRRRSSRTSATSAAFATSSRRRACREQLLAALATNGERRRHGNSGRCILHARPPAAAAARCSSHRSSLDPVRPEHPGALPRMPAGRPGALTSDALE